jgi:hypothetical protein
MSRTNFIHHTPAVTCKQVESDSLLACFSSLHFSPMLKAMTKHTVCTLSQ